jgi:hypothetical protein
VTQLPEPEAVTRHIDLVALHLLDGNIEAMTTHMERLPAHVLGLMVADLVVGATRRARGDRSQAEQAADLRARLGLPARPGLPESPGSEALFATVRFTERYETKSVSGTTEVFEVGDVIDPLQLEVDCCPEDPFGPAAMWVTETHNAAHCGDWVHIPGRVLEPLPQA